MTPDQATQAWIATMGPDAIARSNSYFEGGYWLMLAGWAVTLAACALLIWLKLLPRLRDRIEGPIKNGFVQGVILAIVAIVALSILTFPLDLYAGYFREREFGLSTQTLPEWLGEFAIGFVINLHVVDLGGRRHRSVHGGADRRGAGVHRSAVQHLHAHAGGTAQGRHSGVGAGQWRAGGRRVRV